MRSNFSERMEQMLNLAIGDSLSFNGLTSREFNNLRGEITYFFQGTLKPNDNRLNDDNFPMTLDTDWRIEDTFKRNEDDSHLWDITVTKVETPDKWKYSGVELKLVNERAYHEAQLAAVTDKLDAIAQAKRK